MCLLCLFAFVGKQNSVCIHKNKGVSHKQNNIYTLLKLINKMHF